MKFLVFAIFFFIPAYLFSQENDTLKKIKAVRALTAVKIDGEISEPAWQTAAKVEDMVEQRPQFGRVEDFSTRTTFFLMYDDNAVYVAGICRESRDSIASELVGRDQVGINDFAGLMIDTYRDQINGVGFYVTALGEQYDCKYSLGNEDGSWSAVFKTATKINSEGWTFEMEIPYSALRFSQQQEQNWGINFIRRRTRSGRQVSWSPINPEKFGIMSQTGLWTGIKNIKSPLRLSFSPYFSSYISNSPNATGGKTNTTSVNGGMDVKYGVSKGFTLDMTLIPDFGQVQSDNQVLNLSPFEVRYNEYRAFFTEGTELFNKGNFFYSRRIGGAPVNFSKLSASLDTGAILLENPLETKLINATKFSGRTGNGLGIGIFNAVTRPQHAKLSTPEGYIFKVETNPLTNYNIIALDQTMKNNSSVSLLNTSVIRNGATYDANVTAAIWDLYDKKVNWNFWGKYAHSYLSGSNLPENASGNLSELNFGKFRGPLNFEIHRYFADHDYEQNDMGYFSNNNYVRYGANVWYKWNKPRLFYNRLTFSLNTNYVQQYFPRRYQSKSISMYLNGQHKKLWSFGIDADIQAEQQDFYEPRRAGHFFSTPGSWKVGAFYNSNSAPKYNFNWSGGVRISGKYNSLLYDSYFYNRYRFNDKLTVSLDTYLANHINNTGYAYTPGGQSDSIIFGLRNRKTIENTFNVKYNFNIKMGLTFRARHYWSNVRYKNFFTLQEDGNLKPFEAAGSVAVDNNVNFFNIDMIYTWQFAQGSFINLSWKNAAEIFDRNIHTKYFSNVRNIINEPHQNVLSFKIIYYLDYLTLKRG